MVNLLFLEDRDLLRKEGIVRTLYDPACGTGGMLSIAEEHLRDLNPQARLEVFGQEINPESYAICKADMVIKGHNAANIKFGNSFTTDGLAGERFDYMLSNPPFGVEWKKVEKTIRDEHVNQGFSGRFGAGLPRISDGSLLFLQHMLAKRKENDGGSRIAIVFNGSPLFSGGAGSGESEIRRWLIENDWLEAIVALPDQLFYNTGIPPYVWIVSNRKSPKRKGKIQLINANGKHFCKKMSKSLGNKRNKISEEEPDQIAEITKIYGSFEPSQYCKIFDNADFGYRRIIVERPLRCNFQLSSERIKRISNLKLPHIVLNQASQVLYKALEQYTGVNALYKNQAEFINLVKSLWENSGFKLPPDKQLHAIIMELGERDETADSCTDTDNNWIADPELRDFENVPLKEPINEYFAREVTPHIPDAWINTKVRDDKDGEVGKVGYEIPFTRHFYEYQEPPTLTAIGEQVKELEKQIQGLLHEVIN
jgi:type I restriction enzyme M protein